MFHSTIFCSKERRWSLLIFPTSCQGLLPISQPILQSPTSQSLGLLSALVTIIPKVYRGEKETLSFSPRHSTAVESLSACHWNPGWRHPALSHSEPQSAKVILNATPPAPTPSLITLLPYQITPHPYSPAMLHSTSNFSRHSKKLV